MAGKQWMMATFAAIAIASAASRAVGQAAANQPQPPPTTQPSVDNYLENLVKTITEGSGSQRQDAARLDAAERLVECRQPRARELITQLLSGSDERVQPVIAHAIADSSAPETVWANSLPPLLNRDTATSDFAARALAQYQTLPTAQGYLIDGFDSAPPANRPGIIAAMGRMVQKRVAQKLVSIVADVNQSQDLRSAAGDALSGLSGQSPAGDPTTFWNNWFAARNAQQAIDWRRTVIEEQHAGLQESELHLRDRLNQFRDRINKQELRQYTILDGAQRKTALLLELLNDSDPDLRAAGAYVASDAINGVTPLEKPVRDRLFALVGDPSPEVRRNVAGALFNLFDANALNPILLQLQLEPNLQIKLQLIKALARTDAHALPVLEDIIRQGSSVTAAAAADAISISQAPFFQNNQEIGKGIDFLQKALVDRTGAIGQPKNDPDLIDLRAHLVSAIAILTARAQRPETIKSLVELSRPGEPLPVRVKALIGLGSIVSAANVVGDVLQQALTTDREPAIRAAAATALGSLGSFIYYQDLDNSTQPQNENSPEVIASARQACSRLLPAGTANQTQYQADVLIKRGEDERALEAYKITCAKLAESKADDMTLALDRKTVGDLYLDKFKDPRNAIPQYSNALEYLQKAQVGQQNTESVIKNILTAYFALDDFDTALKFAGVQLNDPRTQDVVGPAIVHRADELAQAPASAENVARARQLIDMALGLYKSGKLKIRDLDARQLEQIASSLPPAPTTNPAK